MVPFSIILVGEFCVTIYNLGYEHDENDMHDVMLLCETFQIAVPDEYKEK